MRALLVASTAAVALAMPASAADVNPRALVLRQSDVPAELRLDRRASGLRTNGEESQGDRGAKAFVTRAGRIVGYVARYVHPGRDQGIESRADVFRDPKGARLMLNRFDAFWRQLAPGIPRARAGIGAESWVYSGSIDSVVAWRHGRVFGSILGVGMTRERTLALARLQQRRIAGALG